MSWLPTVTTAEPASEPVTLTEAKAQCRVTSADEETLLTRYIAAARETVEQFTGLRIIEQTVQLKAGSFDDLARLPVAPIQSVTSVKYLDSAGVEQTLATDVYESVLVGLDPLIRRKYNQSWPSIFPVADAVRVVAVVGFTTVPEPVKHAILLTIGAWFVDRETGTLPDGAIALLANYRR